MFNVCKTFFYQPKSLPFRKRSLTFHRHQPINQAFHFRDVTNLHAIKSQRFTSA